MKQFFTIFKFELKNYLKRKSFIAVTAILIIAITGVMFFPRITSLIKSGDKAKDTTEQTEIMLVGAEDDNLTELISSTFSVYFPEYDVRISEGDEDAIKSQVTNGNADCAFYMKDSVTFVYYVDILSIYDANAEIAREALKSVYQTSAMMYAGMSPEEASAVMSTNITGETVSLGNDQTKNFLYTYIMIFALYTVIILYGQMVAMGVATEKSSRAMEVLITSAKPVSMMFGKVISACLAGFTQLFAIFGSAILFYKINEEYWGENPMISSIFDMPTNLFVYMMIFFVLGFLVYAFLYGAIASTVSKLEDINTAVTPITYVFIIAFIVVMTTMTSGDVDTVLMKVCSYVPFTSSMAMFTRIVMSNVSFLEIILSIVTLIASVIGIGFISAKIYRIGVVMYGNRPKIGAIIKAIKNSK